MLALLLVIIITFDILALCWGIMYIYKTKRSSDFEFYQQQKVIPFGKRAKVIKLRRKLKK